MYEWLVLLLPLAAASGWYAAQRRYGAQYFLRQTKALHASYTRGVGLLLDDKLDEALEVLSAVFHTDAEGLELRLAVGQLFRRKGQVEKALAVHESLAGHQGLSEEQAEFISYQLGLDYLAAGLLDRAEAAFRALLASERYRTGSLQQLLKIYQRERDWQQAIDCTRALQQIRKIPHRETSAQFYCELASESNAAGRPDEAHHYLRLALQQDPKCVRATLAIGGILMAAERWGEAFDTFAQVERQDAGFLPEILSQVIVCSDRMGRESALQNYLRHLYLDHGCEEAACVLVERIKRTEGLEPAIEFLQSAIAKSSSLNLSRKLLSLISVTARDREYAALQLVLNSMPKADEQCGKYRCHRCGFQGNELHWRCPSCQTWETVKPKQ